MVVRIKSRKSKHLGNRTYGGGNKKNRRGKGCRGGKGRAGWNTHKWLLTIKNNEHKRRKRGFASVRAKPATINLTQLSKRIQEGDYKEEIVLKKTKVLSNGDYNHKIKVRAFGFTAKAREKIEAAGGEAVDL